MADPLFSEFQCFTLTEAADLFGGDDNQQLIVALGGNDNILALGGNDIVAGNQGDDFLAGNRGEDTIFGGQGNDVIRAGKENDVISGDLGNDVLHGDVGADTVTGGAGADLFVLGRGVGGATIADADVITDFTDGEDFLSLGGVLQFSDLTISAGSGANEGDTIVRDTLTGEFLAVLQGVSSGDISADDVASESPAIVGFGASEFSTQEGDGEATISVSLSTVTPVEVTVDYATAGGSATEGEDFTATSGSLTFAPGQTTQSFTVSILDDDAEEDVETIQLTLANAMGGLLGTDSAQLLISDNDSVGGGAISDVGDPVNFASVDVTSEDAVRALNTPSVTVGDTSIYIGFEQVSANNQDPRIVSFTNGEQNWFRDDYEVTGDDGTGYGLLWDGADNLYGVFSATGSQGTPEEDFRRFATDGWLPSYGQGGGPEVAIVAKIDPQTGDVTNATYLSAVLSNGNTNTLQVTDLAFNGTNVVVDAQSFFSPRQTDTTPFENTGPDTMSPFDYTIEFDATLMEAVRAEAPGFTG